MPILCASALSSDGIGTFRLYRPSGALGTGLGQPLTKKPDEFPFADFKSDSIRPRIHSEISFRTPLNTCHRSSDDPRAVAGSSKFQCTQPAP